MTLARRVLSSSLLLLAISVAQRSLGLISTIVLARLLTPEDFGIVAIAALVVHFADILSDSGAPQYIVQADRVDDATLATAWTLNLLLKGALTVGIWAALPLFVLAWSSETLLPIAVLAPMIFLRGLQSPQLMLDRRELSYGRTFKIRVGQKLIAFVCAVGLAWYLRSFWAIIVADLVSNAAAVLLSYVLCRGAPRFGLKGLGEQWRFSRWMLLRGSFGYLRAQLDTMIAASALPLAALGRYNMARELTVLPSTLVLMPMLEPLLASFSRCREDPRHLHHQLSLTLVLLVTVTLPIALFLVRHSESLVLTLLGEQWIDVAPVIVALSPVLLVFPIGGVVNSLLIALGRLRTLLLYDIVSLSVLALTLGIVVHDGLVAFAGWRAAIGVLSASIIFCVASRVTGFNPLRAFAALRVPASAAVIALLAIEWSGLPVGPYVIVGTGLCYLIVYSGCLFLVSRPALMRGGVWSDLESLLVSEAGRRVTRWRRERKGRAS